jgi:hypothetical protein
MDPRTPNHEQMIDRLTVSLGDGVFNANSAARFRQLQDARHRGWLMRRFGYLHEELYGYAAARFAAERSENKPARARYLSTNVRAYFKRSRGWLAKTPSR